MQNLEISEEKSTYFVPRVSFNAQTGNCIIEGESYLENPDVFYKTLADWLRNYQKLKKAINFSFKLSYFNSSSQKGILGILKLLKSYEIAKIKVTVNWYYPHDDDDNLYEAQDFIADVKLSMNLIAY